MLMSYSDLGKNRLKNTKKTGSAILCLWRSNIKKYIYNQ